MNKIAAEDSEVHLSIEGAIEVGKTAKEFILIPKFPHNMWKHAGMG